MSGPATTAARPSRRRTPSRPGPDAQRAWRSTSSGPCIDPERIALHLYDLDPKGKLDLSQWTHIAAQGRDHYVRLVYEGRLKDLGHRASLVKVTERRFEKSPSGAPVAYLRQYMYVVVKEPEKYYPDEGLANGGRGMPLRRVRLTTLVTPAHRLSRTSRAVRRAPAVTDRSFWVMVNNQDFLFHGYAEDVAGNRVDFQKPSSSCRTARPTSPPSTPRSRPNRARIRASVPGQKVTFAERLPDGDPGGRQGQHQPCHGDDLPRERGPERRCVLQAADLRGRRAPARGRGADRVDPADVDPVHRGLPGQGLRRRGEPDRRLRRDRLAQRGTCPAPLSTASWARRSTPPRPAASRRRPSTSSASPAAPGRSAASSPTRCPTPSTPSRCSQPGLATLFGAFDLADLLPGGAASTTTRPRCRCTARARKIVTDLDWQSPIDQTVLGRDHRLRPARQPDGAARARRHHQGPGRRRGHLRPRRGPQRLLDRLPGLAGDQVHGVHLLLAHGSKTDVNVHLDDASPVVFEGDLSFVEGLRQIIPPGSSATASAST